MLFNPLAANNHSSNRAPSISPFRKQNVNNEDIREFDQIVNMSILLTFGYLYSIIFISSSTSFLFMLNILDNR